MKNLYKALASAAIALLAASCVNEMGNDTTNGLFRKYNLSFDGSTKTELSGTGSSRQVKWTSGDEIKYYTKDKISSPSTASVTVDGSNAFVEIPRGRSDDFINAVYGAGSLTSSSSTSDCMYVGSPAKNDQNYTTFSQAHLCAAFSSDLEDPNLRFHNAVAILKITSASAISKVVFSGNKGEVITGGSNGSLKISYSGGAISAEPASSGGTSVTIATNGQESDFYIAILPINFSEGIVVRGYDSSGSLVCERKTTGELNTLNAAGHPIIANLGSIQEWLDNPKPIAVDLGLSVKWASFNLGAKTPEGSGDYFSWGETTPKESYTWSTYAFGQSKNGPFSEYVADAEYGSPDYKTILDLEDDAAHALWGDAWRLPSIEEIQELKDNCSWAWTTMNDVPGYKVTSNNTGNFIFLPAAGMMSGSKVQNAGTEGDYWTSSLYAEKSCSSWSPYFTSSEFSNSDCYRYFGLPVRAVYGEVKPVTEIKLNASKLTLYPEESSQLKADILPVNATDKRLIWISSDDAIAKVDSQGLVTAVSPGNATISVYSTNGVFAACSVSVIQYGTSNFLSAIVRDFSFDFHPIAYSCDRDSLWTDWIDMSSTILEDYLSIDYRNFRKDFQIYYKNGATTGIADPNYIGYVLDTYELKSGRSGHELYDYATTKNTVGDFKFGTITYVPDSSGDVTNDLFYFYFNKAQKDAIMASGGTKTLYFKIFEKSTKNYYMLGFKVKVLPLATVEFVLHNPMYWFNDVEKYWASTVRRNVPVPMHYIDNDPENSDVTEFVKSFLDDWDGHVIKIKNSTTLPEIEWSFDTTQPCKVKIGNKTYTFKVHNTDSASNPAATDEQFLSCETQTDTVVVLNRKTGFLRYYWKEDPDYISKKLLNAFAPNENDAAKMLYAKIVITAKSYLRDNTGAIVINARTGKPECEIDLGTESLYARFLRPVTLNFSDKASLRDGVATADYFPIGAFIANARDWNAADYGAIDGLGYPIFQQKTDGTFETCYYDNKATGAHEVDWYAYYGFKNIWIDLSKIETDQYAPDMPQGLLSDINPRAIVFIAKASTPTKKEYVPADGNVKLDITNVASLGDWVFSYENHQGAAHDFHLYVPVSVEYAWGKFDATIAVPVKATQISQGN